MKFPILLALPNQEPLVESAAAAREGRAPTIPLLRARVPGRFTIDDSIAAVPIGEGSAESIVASSGPDGRSELFAVRGYVEAASVDEIPEELDGQRVYSDVQIAPFAACDDVPVGSSSDVRRKIGFDTLTQKSLNGENVAVAIVDTGISLPYLNKKVASGQLSGPIRFDAANSWTPTGLSQVPGQSTVDHGTMCAYDVLLGGPKATLLDYPILASTAPGANPTGRSISVALLAFAELLSNWAVRFAPGGLHALYSGLVINNSWGIYHPSWDFPEGHRGRYCDNPQHPFNLVVTALANSGVDILFAAGNCGADCPDGRCRGRTTHTIMGANAHPSVLTVAGCDINDVRVGYSSQGPSIPKMFQEKPDITAYTHFLGSEAFGPGVPDSGTSTACPVAAGCVAAIRTRKSPTHLPPPALFQQLRSTATPKPGPSAGWNGDYGYGILDPVAAASSLGL